MRLTKREKGLLARQYAEKLYWGKAGSPADLPALKQRRDWQAASEYEQRDIVSELASLARDELLKAGHNRDIVLQYVGPYIRKW